MKKSLLTLLFVLPFLGFGQTLTNKTFDANTNGWQKGAGATSSIAWIGTEGSAALGALKLQANDANARAQTTPDANPTYGAGTYTLTFKVKGDAGKRIRGDVSNNGTAIQGTVLTLTGGWDTYTATYTLINAVTNIRLLAVDTSTNPYYFDDIVWTFQPPAGSTLLTTTIVGQGTVTANPLQSYYTTTDNVTLSATPKSHFVFSGWSGDLTGTTNPASLTMSTNKSVTANFSVDPSFNYAFYFNTLNDYEGWASDSSYLTVASNADGTLTLTPTAGQFNRLALTNFPIPAANYNKLTIKLQNNSATTDQLAIVVSNGTTSATIANTISKSDSGIVTYDFYLNPAVYTSWTGTITDLKLRFGDSLNASPGRASDASTIIVDDIIFSYDASLATLATSGVAKIKSNVQLVLNTNELIFRNATVTKAVVYNTAGQIVKDVQVKNNTVDVSLLKAGVYIVKTVSQDQTESITKFIKN